MKVALIADHLLSLAGSERVFQYVSEEFPDADLFTFTYNESQTFPYFKTRNINATLKGALASRQLFNWAFPVASYVMEKLSLKNYDVVLSCSATVAKYVRPKESIHLCYCYIPTRALWQSDLYFGGSVAGRFVSPALGILRKRDWEAARRVSAFLTISQASKRYIEQFYQRPADVLYCPIDTDRFRCMREKREHFLIVSRLERWKRVDYAVEACRRLDYPLRIIGSGPEEALLRSIAGPKTKFVGNVTDQQLAEEYGQARAVIFTPFIEGGMTPVEANACGTPTICLGKGGVTELQCAAPEGSNEAGGATSVFFYEQTPEAVIDAIRRFDTIHFDPDALSRHADQFSVPCFKAGIRAFVASYHQAGGSLSHYCSSTSLQ